MGGRYGNDATEALAALLNAVRENGAREVEDAWEALSYWLLTMRTAPPDFADPRVQAAAGALRWARHGPGESPAPGLYLRHSLRDPRGDFGALWHCAGACSPDAAEGWGWLYGPLPPPPGWCDTPVCGRSGP